MKFFRLKESYLLFLIVIGLVSLAMYSTFALFTANTEIENVVNFDTTLNLGVRMFEYEMITLQPGETQIIEVNVTNDYTSSLYYGAWYEVITPSDASNIDIGLYTEKNSTPGSGQMESNTSLSLIVGIANYGSEEAIINIGVAGSEDNSLNLKEGRTLIPSGWSEPILVTAEVLEESTTTITETNTTTNPVNLTYTTSGKTTLSLNPGTYKLEVWGAQGGSFNTTYAGGKGGYSYGTLTLTAKTNAYVYVGGQGTNGTSSGTYAGGYNGGGQAYSGSATYDMSGGGGASDIRLGSDNLYARVIVAGGGGGAGSYNGSYRYSGGVGGGTSGTAGGQYSTSNRGGLGGSATSAGTSYYGSTANSTTYGTVANFGNGGAAKNTSTSYYIAGGGGGWYGGGYARRAAGGGGSGYVYTSSTASQCPSGCLLNSSYYLTSAATIAGNTSTNFNNVAGTGTETGHAGNGAAKITGTETITTQTQKTVYTIPRVSGLSDITLKEGESFNLNENVTVECGHDIECSLISISVNDTSKLEGGAYTVYYIVEDENNIKYRFARNLTVLKPSLKITNVLVNNSTYQGIPQTGLYTMTSNCNNATYDRFTKKVKISDFTQYQNCDLNFTTDTNYPLLNTMQVGDYVAYVGNNGCLNNELGTGTSDASVESGNSCLGYNANQPTDGTEDAKGRYGYCYGDNYHYTTYGWRIAYIEDNKVHLISAGSPECRTRTSSTNNATAITDLNTAALDYCNSTYVDGGVCPTTASESNAVRALGNTDFKKITYAISGTTSSLTSYYSKTYCDDQYSYKRCGYGNDLIDNGGYYWFAAHDNSTSGVAWNPDERNVITDTTRAYGFRPVIRLSSSVYVTGGSGTMTDPYTIGI